MIVWSGGVPGNGPPGAAWYGCNGCDGNNPAGQPVYDVQTGRCHDNINLAGEIAPTTGAESAIEAGLLQLVRCRLQGMRAGLETDSTGE